MIAQFLFSVTVHRINGAEYVQSSWNISITSVQSPLWSGPVLWQGDRFAHPMKILLNSPKKRKNCRQQFFSRIRSIPLIPGHVGSASICIFVNHLLPPLCKLFRKEITFRDQTCIPRKDWNHLCIFLICDLAMKNVTVFLGRNRCRNTPARTIKEGMMIVFPCFIPCSACWTHVSGEIPGKENCTLATWLNSVFTGPGQRQKTRTGLFLRRNSSASPFVMLAT